MAKGIRGRSITTKYYNETYPSRKALADAYGLNYKDLLNCIAQRDTIEEAVDELRGINVQKVEDETEELEVGVEEVEELEKDEEEEDGNNNRELLYAYMNSPLDIANFGIEDIETINLIDFENVCGTNFDMLSYINNDKTINIFCYNACIYSNAFFKYIKKSNNMNLQVLSFQCGNNLIDNILLFYLSSLITLYPNKDYVIISKDTTFYEFVGAINKPNVIAIGKTDEVKKESVVKHTKKRLKNKDKYKYSLFKYILDNNIISHRNAIKLDEFDNIFKEFFDNGNKSPDIPGIIKDLIDYGVITRKYLGNLEYYRFDTQKIKDELEEILK